MDYHQYGEYKIPVITGKSARAAYNLPDSDIDKLRCDTNFDEFGSCMESDGFRGTPFGDKFAYIDEAELKERCEFLKAKRASILHLMVDSNVPVKDQNGHGYCWCYGAVSAIEANRLVQGLPYVELNPHSTASRVKNGLDQGGWANEALKGAQEYGVVPASLWPKHSRDYKLWQKPEIAEAGAEYKPKEWVDIDRGDMPALRSLLGSNFACGMGLMWWGHLVMFGILDWSDKHGWLHGQRNSHGPNFGNSGWAFHTENSAMHGGGSTVFVAT